MNPPEWFVEMMQAAFLRAETGEHQPAITQDCFNYFYDITTNSKVHDVVYVVETNPEETGWSVSCVFSLEAHAYSELAERVCLAKSQGMQIDVRVKPWAIRDTEQAWSLPD